MTVTDRQMQERVSELQRQGVRIRISRLIGVGPGSGGGRARARVPVRPGVPGPA